MVVLLILILVAEASAGVDTSHVQRSMKVSEIVVAAVTTGFAVIAAVVTTFVVFGSKVAMHAVVAFVFVIGVAIVVVAAAAHSL